MQHLLDCLAVGPVISDPIAAVFDAGEGFAEFAADVIRLGKLDGRQDIYLVGSLLKAERFCPGHRLAVCGLLHALIVPKTIGCGSHF